MRSTPLNTKLKSAGKWLYRYGVVFSAAMVAISLLNNLGVQLANKLGISKEQASAEASNKLPYQKPTFNLFSSVISEAKAVSHVNALS